MMGRMAPRPSDANIAPQVRSIALTQPLRWLALGPADEQAPRRESDDHPGPFRNDYERTKAIACRKVRALKAGHAPRGMAAPDPIAALAVLGSEAALAAELAGSS